MSADPDLPGVGQQFDHGRGRQRVAVSTPHETDGPGVSEHHLTVLLAHDDALGERVEGVAQADGVGRRLGHRFGGAVGDLLQVVQGRFHSGRVLLRGLHPEAGGQGRQSLLERGATRAPAEDGGQHDPGHGHHGENDEADDGDRVRDPPGRTHHRSPDHYSPAWQAGTGPRCGLLLLLRRRTPAGRPTTGGAGEHLNLYEKS